MKLITWPYLTSEYLLSQGLSKTFPERFWEKVVTGEPNECWLWIGSLSGNGGGYGQIWRGFKNPKLNISTHRASWILNRGPIPEDKWVLHCCPGRHNPPCCNPNHLYLGDVVQNMDDSLAQGSVLTKLTQEQVDEIRRCYTGKYGEMKTIAKQYGVTSTLVGLLLRGKAWRRSATEPSKPLLDLHAKWKVERERVKGPSHAPGEGNNNAKLTWVEVNEIRQKYDSHYGSQTALAREYGVGQACVWKIVTHRIWKT